MLPVKQYFYQLSLLEHKHSDVAWKKKSNVAIIIECKGNMLPREAKQHCRETHFIADHDYSKKKLLFCFCYLCVFPEILKKRNVAWDKETKIAV